MHGPIFNLAIRYCAHTIAYIVFPHLLAHRCDDIILTASLELTPVV